MSHTQAGIVAVLDKRFEDCVAENAQLDLIWSDGIWTEGPAWQNGERRLIWSDIPNNRMLQWHAETNDVTLFRHPSHGANGNTVDRQGRLLTCEQYSRRISRTERDGLITVLVDRFGGKRFNAPNDIVVSSDGAIWFTDPDYGRSSEYEGELELDGCHVYRLDPTTGAIRQMTHDFVMPNGLAFSPDERWLYIVDTGSTHIPGGPNHLRRFVVESDAGLSGGEVLLSDPNLFLDGFRVDLSGRLWCGAGDGVDCYAPDGTLIGKIAVPERVGNVCFGGLDGRDLFMCASRSVFRIRTRTRG